MTITTPAIPGLVIDDSPDRPAHKPRITFECSAVAVRAALTATNADALAEFERQFHVAMAEADDDFDLGRVDKVVRHWWLRAIHYLDADATAYTAAVVEQLQRGDESALAPKGRAVIYEVRYTTRAAEQRDSLPPDGQRALAALENQLSSDPWSAGREAKSEGAWYADFGDFGQAKYVIGEDGVVRVTVLFITWVG